MISRGQRISRGSPEDLQRIIKGYPEDLLQRTSSKGSPPEDPLQRISSRESPENLLQGISSRGSPGDLQRNSQHCKALLSNAMDLKS